MICLSCGWPVVIGGACNCPLPPELNPTGEFFTNNLYPHEKGMLSPTLINGGVPQTTGLDAAKFRDPALPVKPPRLMVMGHGRHGKDTVCELLPFSFQSSSIAAAEIFLFEHMRHQHAYATVMDCFNDRHNHREKWHRLISEYNTPDKTRLARGMFARNPVYCGIRCREEFLQARKEGLFDLAIWVDASKRLPPEDSSSISVTIEDADIIIDNNGTLSELSRRVERLSRILLGEFA